MSVTITLSDHEVLESITSRQVVDFFGEELLDYFTAFPLIEAAGGIDEILADLDDSRIDQEFLQRHPNPSEVLDYLDDEAIMDYLINKGYNIEM